MDNSHNIYDISGLIFKKLIGSLSEEETMKLERWRSEKKENDMLYHKLSTKEHLKEFRERKLVDTEKPLHHMQTIIARERLKRRKRVLYTMSSIAAVLIVGLFITFSRNSPTPNHVPQEIRPGGTKAILTLGNGKQIVLDTAKLIINEEGISISNLNNEMLSYTLQKDPGINTKSMINKIEVPRGGEFDLELQDGTRIWLNSESTLTYPALFSGTERKVYLEGEAYFEVKSDSTRPFIVVSGQQEVTVLGTKFNISAYSGATNIYTTLLEGKVQVSGGVQQKPLVLFPGQQVILNQTKGEFSRKTVDVEKTISWRMGWFIFEEISLDEAMSQLARWYDFSYFYQNPNLANTILSARLERFANVREIFNILEETGHLKFSQNGKNVIIMGN